MTEPKDAQMTELVERPRFDLALAKKAVASPRHQLPAFMQKEAVARIEWDADRIIAYKEQSNG